jgi:eukaryotic-like serine/threonine-protein kinase
VKAPSWPELEALFHEALSQVPAERSAFLVERCAGRLDLQAEVEALLRAHERTASALEVPQTSHTQLKAGMRLGSYEVLSELGAGSMGEVYRARDTRLGRDVAIKVLPALFLSVPERRTRFEREARVLASLNHPHIAAIYGVEEAGATLALVLELVEGPTLADRSAHGPLPLEQALPLAQQIAEALEAAHEKAIVHRDLKPANIKITPAGTVKVLDFGIAKASAADGSRSDLSHSPSITATTTHEGVILGTAAYMSPEQARGHAVDKQTDIWAFGCVMYEMLTARQAFPGETLSDTIAAVLEREPDWNALPAGTPSIVRLLLRRCLKKDPRERLRDIADWRMVAQEAATEELRAPGSRKSFRSRRNGLLALSAIAILLLVIGVGVSYFSPFRSELPEMRVEITTPATPDPVSFAISPNGEQLVFLASSAGSNTQLWLRALDAAEARPLADTDGASYPFWSPDSRAIAFFADGKLKRIDLTGGPSRVLATAPVGRGGSWSQDGVIVFTPGPRAPLYRVSSDGGEAVALTRLDPPRLTSHRAPYFLPDGRHFLFQGLGDSELGVFLGSLDQPEPRRVLNAARGAIYAAGHVLFVRDAALFAQRFDAGKLQLAGEPFQVASQVASQNGFAVSSAGNGTVVYRRESRPEIRQLIWFDRSGQMSGHIGDPDKTSLLNPELSPDGKRVAVERTVGAIGPVGAPATEVWIMETVAGVPTRLTFGDYRFPIWSPDGSRLAFASVRTGLWRLYQKLATGLGEEDLVPGQIDTATGLMPTEWSPDGRIVLFESPGQPQVGRSSEDLPQRIGDFEIWALPLNESSKPFRAVSSRGDQRSGQFSPDGRWIAYQSDEDGKQEIYVQRFPGPGGKVQISTAGGTQPRWRADGHELFYIGLDGRLMATPISFVEGGAAIKAGPSLPLFSTHLVAEATVTGITVNRQQYDVSPDGQRFLMNVPIEPEAASPLTVILNWRAEPTK